MDLKLRLASYLLLEHAFLLSSARSDYVVSPSETKVTISSEQQQAHDSPKKHLKGLVTSPFLQILLNKFWKHLIISVSPAVLTLWEMVLWHLSCLHFPMEKQRNISVGFNSVRFSAAKRWFFSDSLWKKSGLWSPTRVETVLPIPSHDLGKNLVQEIRKNRKYKPFVMKLVACTSHQRLSLLYAVTHHKASQGIFHTSQMLQFQ